MAIGTENGRYAAEPELDAEVKEMGETVEASMVWREDAEPIIRRLRDSGINGGTLRAVTEALYDAWSAGNRRGVSKVAEEATKSRAEAAPEGREVQIAQDLERWWIEVAESEVQPLIAKMIEYGGLGRATDLEEIGRGLVHSGVKEWKGSEAEEVATRQYQEMGIYFYLLGKFARWTAAVAEGRPVSDDTLLDIGIYVRMAQRVRAVGGWPV